MTHTVLFVDDEQMVLDGLRRSLRDMRREWNMLFATSARDALEFFEQYQIDLIVSDMRMPQLDGAELLGEVKKRDPRTIRFILSGQTSAEDAKRLEGVCQQFLSKPCDTEKLIALARQAFQSR